MREIKFRAWNKISKTMYGNSIYNCKDSFDMQLKHPQIYELMQYTGLKDKNGVKIYEGDIVSAWSEGICAKGVVTKRVDGLWIIKPSWQNNKLWGICPDKKGFSEVEVIGNIYENPELLENNRE